jgi:hypothetical protein
MAQANFEPTFSCINTLTILKPSYYSSYPPAYEDGTECSETSAYKIQTPGNYTEKKHTKFRIAEKMWNVIHPLFCNITDENV